MDIFDFYGKKEDEKNGHLEKNSNMSVFQSKDDRVHEDIDRKIDIIIDETKYDSNDAISSFKYAIEIYGIGICNDKERLQSVLTDLTYGNNRDIKFVIMLCDCNDINLLLNGSSSDEDAKRLIEKYFIYLTDIEYINKSKAQEFSEQYVYGLLGRTIDQTSESYEDDGTTKEENLSNNDYSDNIDHAATSPFMQEYLRQLFDKCSNVEDEKHNRDDKSEDIDKDEFVTEDNFENDTEKDDSDNSINNEINEVPSSFLEEYLSKLYEVKQEKNRETEQTDLHKSTLKDKQEDKVKNDVNTNKCVNKSKKARPNLELENLKNKISNSDNNGVYILQAIMNHELKFNFHKHVDYTTNYISAKSYKKCEIALWLLETRYVLYISLTNDNVGWRTINSFQQEIIRFVFNCELIGDHIKRGDKREVRYHLSNLIIPEDISKYVLVRTGYNEEWHLSYIRTPEEIKEEEERVKARIKAEKDREICMKLQSENERDIEYKQTFGIKDPGKEYRLDSNGFVIPDGVDYKDD